MSACLVVVVVGSLFNSQQQTSAAAPALGWGIARYLPALEGIGYGVAGNFVYDAAKNAWTWTTPDSRNGTISVTPSLVVESSSREKVYWYGNEEVGGSYGAAHDEDREFARYDITIQQVTWDSDAAKFVVDHSHHYHGGSFQTYWEPYMTAQKDGNGGWYSGGWYLVRGEAEKSSVTHAIESKATVGDFTLFAIGDPGYKATARCWRSKMRYQGGGGWTYQPETKIYKQSRNLSAIQDDRAIVDLVDRNTKLISKKVTGSSELRWVIKTVPVEVVFQRQTYSFDEDHLRIPGPIEEERQQTNAPVWDIEQKITD